MGKHHCNQHLAGIDFSALSHEDCIESLHDILDQGIHGICFSPYLDGQGPGTEIDEAQIRQRLEIIQPYTHWIRTFACTEGHQHTPRIAHELGLKTMVGVSIGDDHEKNLVELYAGIEVAIAGDAVMSS